MYGLHALHIFTENKIKTLGRPHLSLCQVTNLYVVDTAFGHERIDVRLVALHRDFSQDVGGRKIRSLLRATRVAHARLRLPPRLDVLSRLLCSPSVLSLQTHGDMQLVPLLFFPPKISRMFFVDREPKTTQGRHHNTDSSSLLPPVPRRQPSRLLLADKRANPRNR